MFETRNLKIKKHYFQSNWSLTKIGKKYKLTPERVRQICNNLDTKTLLKEVELKYGLKFKDSPKQLLEDVVMLSKQNRTKEVVAKRNYMIAYLKDELGLNLNKIAILLNRDYSSIYHSYQNSNE